MASNSDEDVSSECSFGWVDIEHKKTKTKKISSSREAVMSSDNEGDSDATEFEDGSDSDKEQHKLEENASSATSDPPRPMEDSSGVQNDSRNENSTGSLADNSQYEDENSDEEEDKKLLKPFTKELIVKKERFSHTLSDDGNDDSPPTRRSMRVKSESNRLVQKHEKVKKSGALVEGSLVDSSQTLPFNIGADEDVWIVQCPRDVSASTLKGKTLNFMGVSRIDHLESNVLTTSKIESVNLLVPKPPGKIINVVPNGHIIFKEKETMPQAINTLHKEENVISLPAGLKLRHPLFGTELSLVKTPFGASPAKKKKKKKHKQPDTIVENENSAKENGETVAENITDCSNHLKPSPSHVKIKNKKRHGDGSDELEKEILLRDSEGKNSISVKKIKKYETDISDNYRMSGADGYSMSNSLTETSLVLDNDNKMKKKKKKKHKYEKEFESEDVKPINQPNEDDEYSTSLLTQRLHESADDLLAGSSADILKQKKKKKKIKQEDYNEISNFSSETADDSFVASHKKRKKKKLDNSDGHLDLETEGASIKKQKKLSQATDNSTKSFDRTILDEEQEYLDETPIKKKKKKKSE